MCLYVNSESGISQKYIRSRFDEGDGGALLFSVQQESQLAQNDEMTGLF